MKKTTKTFETIETKLYPMPGDFFIDVRESGRGYTDFYLYNSHYAYAHRIYREKTRDLPKNLDELVAQLFLNNFLKYIRAIDDDHCEVLYHFEDYYFRTSVETFKEYIKNRIEKKEYFAHSERVTAIYKPGTAWTFEVSDGFEHPGDIAIYLAHKDRPDVIIEIDILAGNILDGRDLDIIHHIDINKDYYIKEYKEDIDDIFNKDI